MKKKTHFIILSLISFYILFIRCNTAEVIPEPMIYPKYNHTVNELNGNVYIIGGYSFGKYLSVTEIYRGLSNRWINSLDMNIGRSEHRSIVFNDRIFVTGGKNIGGVLNECETLDSLNRWKRIADLNYARSSHNMFVVNDNIYVCGGVNHFDKPVLETEKYNQEKLKWEIVAKIKFPVVNAELIVVDNLNFIGKLKKHYDDIVSKELVFVLGGYIINNSDELIPSDKVQFFDPELNEWFAFTPTNTTKIGHTFDFVKDSFYVIGGDGSRHHIEKYNPEKNKWEIINKTIIGRSYHTTIVNEDNIYIIGGKDESSDEVLNSMELYNIFTEQKTREEPMSYPRYKHTSILYKDNIFVIGGIGDFSLSSIEFYSFEDKKWVSSY